MTALVSTLKPQVPDTLERGDRWQTAGACRETDPELFFPVGEGALAQQQTTEAVAICNGCPVRDTCLEWALGTRQEHGVWGGRSEADRRSILRRRARGQADPEPKPTTPRTHRSVHAQYVRPVEGGHSTPARPTGCVSINGERFTLPQLAFFLHHGRRADGKVAAHCGKYGCLTGSHLGDAIIRADRDAAVAAARESTATAWSAYVNDRATA